MSAEDVRKLHTKFGLYGGCDCEYRWKKAGVPELQWPPESDVRFHDGKEPVEIEETGWTCEEPQWVCRECDTSDGEAHENSDYGEWPCRTIEALDKP